jgi:hypothetical protein
MDLNSLISTSSTNSTLNKHLNHFIDTVNTLTVHSKTPRVLLTKFPSIRCLVISSVAHIKRCYICIDSRIKEAWIHTDKRIGNRLIKTLQVDTLVCTGGDLSTAVLPSQLKTLRVMNCFLVLSENVLPYLTTLIIGPNVHIDKLRNVPCNYPIQRIIARGDIIPSSLKRRLGQWFPDAVFE